VDSLVLLAWANDSTLYYTTREPRETLTDGLTPEQTQMLETATGGSGLVVGTYAVHIRQFNPATGEDRLVYAADGTACGSV
jgi:hypothetical protein